EHHQQQVLFKQSGEFADHCSSRHWGSAAWVKMSRVNSTNRIISHGMQAIITQQDRAATAVA
ncbi:MAG: hypothetical protein ACO1NQ_09035, partial [Flavobacteriales bacterium]